MKRSSALETILGPADGRKRRGFRVVQGAVIALFTGMTAFSPSSQAALSVDTIADCTVATSDPLGPCPSSRERQSSGDENVPWDGTPVVANASNGYAGTQSQAYAQAKYGVLKVTGHSEATGGLPSNQYNIGTAYGWATWNDQININSDGLARDTPAILTVNFAIGGGFTRQGELSVNPGAFDGFSSATQATWDVYVWDAHMYGSHDGATFVIGGHDDNWLDGVAAPGIFGGFSISAPILLGETFDIRMELSGRAAAIAYGQYTRAWSDFDLGQSAYWGGIADVTVDGASVPFTLTSQSGHDWTQSSIPSAVPLPAAVWLFGSALLGLIGVGRRRGAERPTTTG